MSHKTTEQVTVMANDEIGTSEEFQILEVDSDEDNIMQEQQEQLDNIRDESLVELSELADFDKLDGQSDDEIETIEGSTIRSQPAEHSVVLESSAGKSDKRELKDHQEKSIPDLPAVPLEPEKSTEIEWQQENMPISDLVKSIAEQTYTQELLPGYVLHTESGMYYNCQTGYYYDQTSHLFYHPAFSQYYYYDQETNEYKIWEKPKTTMAHSQKFSSHKYRRLASRYRCFKPTDDHQVFEILMDLLAVAEVLSCRKRKRLYSHTNEDDDVQFAEDVDDMIEEYDYDMHQLSDEAKELLLMQEREKQEAKVNQSPPCIRLMEMPQCTLHIVTVTGAIIGKNTDSNICINDDTTVSRKHANISYCEKEKLYVIEDMASHHGTFVNGNLVSGRKSVKHLDRIKICTKLFVVHLHAGDQTCIDCDPGLETFDSGEKGPKVDKNAEVLRRQELQKLKKQYGLEESNFITDLWRVQTKYLDRAGHRRKTEGSEQDVKDETKMASDLPANKKARVERLLTTQKRYIKLLDKDIEVMKTGQKLDQNQPDIVIPQ